MNSPASQLQTTSLRNGNFMRPHSHLPRFLLAFILLCSTAVAQDAVVRPTIEPIAIWNFGSVTRGLNDLTRMFEIAGRPDMSEVILGFIGSTAGDLKGIDRERNIGIMIFLGTGLPPRPVFVPFLPVEKEDEFVATLQLTGQPISPKSEGRYVIGKPDTPESQFMFQDKYALFVDGTSEFFDEVTIPDPDKVVGALGSRYDVSFSVILRSIPPLMRGVFGSYLAQQSAAQMQQRDHESDASYQARRAGGLSSIQFVEQLIKDGEELTIGVDSAEDGRKAVLELKIDAADNSQFAKYLASVSGTPSIFTPLLGDRHPLQISASWNADKREQTALNGYLEAGRLGLNSKLPADSTASVDSLFKTLQSTVDAGHIDMIAQFIPYRDNEFVLLYGLKVVGAETLESAIRDAALTLAEHSEKVQIEMDVHQYNSVKFSRLRLGAPPANVQKIYGGAPDIYFAVSNNVLWIGLGCGGTLPSLESAIDKMETNRAAAGTTSSAPFQLILRTVPWLKITGEGKSPREARRLEAMNGAMKPEDDALRIEVRPTDSGCRVTCRFDEGFVRLLGQIIASRYDQSQL